MRRGFGPAFSCLVLHVLLEGGGLALPGPGPDDTDLQAGGGQDGAEGAAVLLPVDGDGDADVVSHGHLR